MKRLITVLTINLAVALPSFAQPNPERNAYFGETHLHTSWSVDAWVMGNRITGPDDAFKYAQGQPIKHPMGFEIKIETPMDFMGVTDHSEYVGVTKEANIPGSYVNTSVHGSKARIASGSRWSARRSARVSILARCARSLPRAGC